MKAAVFFERDGVLNQVAVRHQHQIQPLQVSDFKVNTALRPRLDELKRAGFVLLATTNQPEVSRGRLSRRELDSMHDLLQRELPLDGILLCAHEEADQCTCRKPRTGLLTEAAFKWHLDLERSYVISDKWQDAQAAHVAGCTSILVQSPWNGKGHHDFVVPDVPGALNKVLQLQSASGARLQRAGA